LTSIGARDKNTIPASLDRKAAVDAWKVVGDGRRGALRADRPTLFRKREREPAKREKGKAGARSAR